MSDPFDALRTTSSAAPDIAGIKARAGRIQRRRRVAVSSTAVVIALIAGAGLIMRPGALDQNANLAQGGGSASATPPSEFEAAGDPSQTSAAAAAGSAPKRATLERRDASAPSPAQEQTTMAAAAPAADSSKQGDALEVTVTASDIAGPRSVRFELQACNRNAQAVQRTFNSGQRYDFDVTRNGTLVWRWSDGMFFTQAFGEERWEPKSCKTYSATWNGTDRNGAPVSTGTYQVVGTLTSAPKQTSAPKSFCLDLC